MGEPWRGSSWVGEGNDGSGELNSEFGRKVHQSVGRETPIPMNLPNLFAFAPTPIHKPMPVQSLSKELKTVLGPLTLSPVELIPIICWSELCGTSTLHFKFSSNEITPPLNPSLLALATLAGAVLHQVPKSFRVPLTVQVIPCHI